MFEETSDLPNKTSSRPLKLPDDEPFLRKLYFSTREQDFQTWAALGKEQAENLLEMQYRGQVQQYKNDFPDARHLIILFEDNSVGRLLSARNAREVHCVDIAILPEFRGLGIGTIILKSLIDEAETTNRIFALQVLKGNPAINLYNRLGFQIVSESSSHFAMERQPTT